jgi:hypothetical protein
MRSSNADRILLLDGLVLLDCPWIVDLVVTGAELGTNEFLPTAAVLRIPAASLPVTYLHF